MLPLLYTGLAILFFGLLMLPINTILPFGNHDWAIGFIAGGITIIATSIALWLLGSVFAVLDMRDEELEQ